MGTKYSAYTVSYNGGSYTGWEIHHCKFPCENISCVKLVLDYIVDEIILKMNLTFFGFITTVNALLCRKTFVKIKL